MILKKLFDSFKKQYQQQPHSWLDDLQGLMIGAALIALGVFLVKSAGLFISGLAGVSLLIHYGTGSSFSLIFFLINLPFYYLAYVRFGILFVVKTVFSVTMLSLLVALIPGWMQIQSVAPYLAAALGGVCIGIGMLALFRHKASAGGVNVFVLYLQDKFGLNAGICQMLIDGMIVLTAFFFLPLQVMIPSILCGVIMNLSIAVNHRKGRYISF